MQTRPRPRVVLFGMRCIGSPPALRALLAADYDVRAVVMPGSSGGPALTVLGGNQVFGMQGRPLSTVPVPMAVVPGVGADGETEDTDGIARAAGIPVLLVANLRDSAVVAAIEAHRPEVIAVACFTLRVPRRLLALPPFGCLNVHPSLLPRGRGVEPVFWTLRRGEPETGVSIHLMDAGFDTGPILLQERVPVPEGVRLPDLERELSERGARLLVQAIDGLLAGTIVPRPQDDRLATSAPNPTADDYLVATDRSARWAYNFARGVAPLDGPLTLHVVETGERLRLRDALGYGTERPAHPIVRDGDEIVVRFADGAVRFLLPKS
jgi:methionyl-tRNA formyltransferase